MTGKTHRHNLLADVVFSIEPLSVVDSNVLRLAALLFRKAPDDVVRAARAGRLGDFVIDNVAWRADYRDAVDEELTLRKEIRITEGLTACFPEGASVHDIEFSLSTMAVNALAFRDEHLRTGRLRACNLAGLLLLVSDESAGEPKCMYELLLELAKYRLISQDKSVWEASGVSPSREDILRLIHLASSVGDYAKHDLLHTHGMLLVVRLLAETLLQGQDPSLRSDDYRRWLWTCIEKTVWHEVLQCAYARALGKECPDRGGVDTLHAHLWLVSQLGYKVLGVDPALQVYEHMCRAFYPETLLHLELGGYRDHLLHALHTFLLGFLLLTSANGPLPGPLGKNWNDHSKQILRNWFLASLWHDYGYFMQLQPGLGEAIGFFGTEEISQELKKFGDDWLRLLGKLNAVCASEVGLHCDLGTGCDHGIMSFLHMRQRFVDLDKAQTGHGVPESSASLLRVQYRDALHAVATHNLPEEPIEILNKPVAGTLIVCDELQEWARPRYRRQELRSKVVALANVSEANGAQQRTVCDGTPRINGSIAKGQLVFDGDVPTIAIRYADQNENVFEPLAMLLGKVYNLERIGDLHQMKLSLEMWLPLLTDHIRGGPAVGELEILTAFASTEAGAYVSPELFTPRSVSGRRDHRCVYLPRQIVPSAATEYEALILNLWLFPDLPKSQPLVRAAPSTFRSSLWDFKLAFCRKRGVVCRFLEER